MVEVKEKRCSDCNEVKNIEEFGVRYVKKYSNIFINIFEDNLCEVRKSVLNLGSVLESSKIGDKFLMERLILIGEDIKLMQMHLEDHYVQIDKEK